VAKAGRRKRRQAAAETARGNARAEEYGARLAARSAAGRRPPTWADRVSPWGWFGLCSGGLVGALFAQFALWQWVIPPLGDVVGRVPVLSTVVGWLFAGGAFVAVGVAVVNDKTAREVTRRRLRLIAYVWGGLAVLCLPIGWAEGVTLPTDYWAGVFAGAYGVAASPLAFLVVAFVWWLVSLVVKPARAAKDGPAGWVFIGYGVLLLVWGSTLLRM
jgi:hypothetical protein